MTTPETMDLFAGVINDIANGPKVQDLTEMLLRRLAEKGLTLEQCADRRMLNRAISTLEAHCRDYGISFSDYTPPNMRKHVRFVQSGDYLELTGAEVGAVAAILGIVTTTRGGVPSCAVPVHAYDDAKAALKAASYEVTKTKPPRRGGRPPMPKDLAKLSARKLHELIEARRIENSRLLNEVIAAGFGNWRGAELRDFAKKSSLLENVLLVRDHIAAADSYHEAADELDARRRWHGEDKPIRRAQIA